MTSIVQTIKDASLAARKARDKTKSDLFTTLLGDIQFIAKNDGSREPTDSDAVSTVKKYLKNTEETLSAYLANATPIPVQSVVDAFNNDKALLESLLPKQLNQAELGHVIDQLINEIQATSTKDMGKVMKVLKDRHNGLYDGSQASSLIKTKLA